MKDSEKKDTNQRYGTFRSFQQKLILAGFLLAVPILVSAQCTLIINNPPAVCSPTTVNLTGASITSGSDVGLSFTYWTNALATVVLANPGAVTASGTYFIKAVNNSGCSIVKPVVVTVNLPVVPVFATIGPLCQNSTAPVLPLTSGNGITGVWNPSAISTVAAGTTVHTFTPAAGQCAVSTILQVTVIPMVIPTFNAIPFLCVGEIPPVLPVTSLNGIVGTWAPAVISNTATQTYVFTPAAGQCATTTAIVVTVRNYVTPVFAPVGPFCPGSIPPALPAVSTNGITGTWFPAAISTATLGVRAYTFTPDVGQCSAIGVITILVTDQIVPVFAPVGPFCIGSTPSILPSTSLNGIAGTWNPAVISTANAGTSVYIFNPATGQCGVVTSMIITVTTSIGPVTITGPATRCQGAGTVLYTATSVNAKAMSFYLDVASAAGGNTINPTSGAVTFAATWTGPTIITAIAEGCGGPAISSLTVNTFLVPYASISYPGSPYCKSIATKQPVTLTGTAGGVFSASPSGLVIDPATGEITPATSDPGNYTVSYKAGTGCAEVIATASITISTCNVRPITVTVSRGLSKVFGNPDPVFTYYYSPILDPGDRFTGLLSRAPGESIGNYPITQGTLSAGTAYQILFIPANFEIIASTADATLADLKVDGTTISGFSPSILTYDLVFLPGTTVIPVITATANNPKSVTAITPAAAIPGSTKIRVTSEDGSRQLTYEVKMTVQTTGIENLPDQVSFNVFPNPNNGTFHFEYRSAETGPVRLSVIDITGKMLREHIYPAGHEISEIVQIPDPVSGIYFVRLISGSEVSYRKVIVE